ncbi:MAG: hypothetical protein ACRENB_11315 [Gemmatimonadales bacterium]
MLSPSQLATRAESKTEARRARPLPSPKQRYQEYLLQRIEDYKNSLPREELLRLGNEAADELQAAAEGQYFLTEVLMQEMVDRLIMKRLAIPSFSRWRQKFARLRAAQREPTHWGIERHSAIAALLARVETGDHAIVAGAGAESAACLLAAHDVRVTCLLGDNGAATRIETRMAAESLSGDFEALVVNFGSWFPELQAPAHYVVVDAAGLAGLPPGRRLSLVARLQDATVPGGLHALIAGDGASAPEGFMSLYPDWERVSLPPPGARRGTKRPPAQGVLLVRPAGPPTNTLTLTP